MAQKIIRDLLESARLDGDGWLTVKQIHARIPTSSSLSRKNAEHYVRNMVLYGMLDFRFKSMKSREVRLKASHMCERSLSRVSHEKELSYNTANAHGKRENFSPGDGRHG